MIEEKDRLLLSHLQKGLPLSNRPFAALGTKIGTDAADVLLRIEKLRREGLLAGVKAVWNYRAFRYQGAWVAMRVKKEALEEGAKIIGEHPGVIYGAEREHNFNFWFFITVPVEHDLEAHVRILEKQITPEAALFLPSRKVLKGTHFLRALDERFYEPVCEGLLRKLSFKKSGLLLNEMRIVRVMQDDLPVTDEPFRRFSEKLGIPEEQFLELLNGLMRKGYLKHIGAHLTVKKASSESGTLVVWKIPEEKLDKVAEFFVECPAVVFADVRHGYPEFPYPVHTLVRAGDAMELEALTRRIEDGIGKWPHQAIRLAREIKKTPMRYFPKELDAWWVRNRHVVETAFQQST